MAFIGFIAVGVFVLPMLLGGLGRLLVGVLFYCTFDVCFSIMCLLGLFWLDLLRCCVVVWVFDGLLSVGLACRCVRVV